MFFELTCKLPVLLHVPVVEVQFILEVGTSIGALQGKSESERKRKEELEDWQMYLQDTF